MNLNLTVDIDQIVDVKDLELKFVVKLTLKIEWFDVQLKWINLNDESSTNFLSKREIDKIWTPKVQFGNSENIKPIAVDNSAVFYIERRKPGESRIYLGEKRRAIYFEGKENPLIYKRTYQEEFFCNFDYSWFPFDTQKCYITFKTFNSMERFVNIIPKKVIYSGQKSLMVFNVVDYYFDAVEDESDLVTLNIEYD